MLILAKQRHMQGLVRVEEESKALSLPLLLLSLKTAANFPVFLINAEKGRALMSQDEAAQRGGDQSN